MRRFFSSQIPRFPRPFTLEHHELAETISKFVKCEILPNVDAWDELGAFPVDLYRKAGDIGLLQVGFPSSVGGIHGDIFSTLILAEELSKGGSGGLIASLCSHAIAMPPLVALGSTELIERIVKPVLRGEKISALAVTEPSGGSDVAAMKTQAVKDSKGDYVLNGEKCFITSGVRADFITVAARTGGPGPKGISLFVVDGHAPGLERTRMKKMGWWCSDTAYLRFSDVVVPAENLIGKENEGFKGIMSNFNSERLMLAAQALGLSRVCLEEATSWAKQRSTFGMPLIERQVIRHKIVDMASRINAVTAYMDIVAATLSDKSVADICSVKNEATLTLEHVANESLQILGGSGYMRGHAVERIYRETKVLSIGGGATEILKDLSAKQMGL